MIALLSGGVVGLCVASLLLILQLPQRVWDIAGAGCMRLFALALTLGASCAALALGMPETLRTGGALASAAGVLTLFLGGVFVGTLASALTEVLEVIPALYVRLRISCDMRMPAVALMIGKALGALLAGVMNL